MRSTIVAAALVAGVIAVPYQKRDIVYDYDVVTVTNIVTVTDGETVSTSSAVVVNAAASTTASVSSAAHVGHHHYHWSTKTSSSSTAALSSSSAVVPIAESSSTVAPAPSSSSAPPPSPSSTSVYIAPTTSTSIYVAPTTTSTYVAPPPSSTSTSVAASSAAPASSAAAAAPSGYQGIATYHHNLHRANHSAPDITWDDGLATTAAQIAASCVYAHNVDANGGGYGQNIAAGVKPDNISAIITDLFYNGEVGWYPETNYDSPTADMTNFEKWGHFSQIVWKGTTKFACATQDCSAKGLANVGSDVAPFFTVCNYQDPGNYAGEYQANVLKGLNKATVEWSAGL